MDLKEFRIRARKIINDPGLTYHQRRHKLALLAEELVEYPPLGDEAKKALDERVICDLYEGHAPYRPRYILPDYEKALKQGSEFLELDPPTNLAEALNFLTILYSQVPSITGFPVYLGDIDRLLIPFLEGVSDDELYHKLKLFWRAVDRMFPDGFVHANLGPEDTRVGRVIFKIERELKQVVPNLTLKYDPEVTTDELLLEGIKTVFAVGKPHFANHPMMVKDLGEKYAVVSCYNSLKIGGGSHTLVRLNLKKTVEKHSGDIESYFKETLPHYVELTLQVMEARIRYLVEEAKFFEHDFLAQEGLISLDQFSAMFGIFGLAEAVNLLMESKGRNGRYGHDEEANQLSYRITDVIAEILAQRPLPYCDGNGGKAFFHSQSGIDLDVDVTAGTRIPYGDEPEIFEHITAVAPHHYKFQAGISDIFHFENTVQNNPQAVADIIKGAFAQGMRDFTFNLADGEFVRITGYLVRRSDLEQMKREKRSRYDSTVLGYNAVENQGIFQRKRRVISREQTPGTH
ncbi:YjjI family glycine radical enzyme [Anoxybacter fermentans]|uniref:YjjI family glycine radical enzyme n=1 Tax=Anoxybacter fermentans TaxID=1323375 RepID=A0A3Q9HPY6_9FIRM|nr:YjjI family glycine radical enzyme [Anoxybacter fermentans]AZR72915.1 YjjI family glycine radical enzyme [Anoxybacter fermentans]